MNKQEYYRDRYSQVCTGWKDSLLIYKELISDRTSGSTRILSVGCGHGDFLASVFAKAGEVYGIDPDEKALLKNEVIENTAVGFVEKMPFEDDFFDLVISEFVLEHIEDPDKAFSEIYRVLKPGGEVIFLTPNVWNYNVWLIRAIPEVFHEFLTTRLYDRQENDTYPKFYRANSRSKLNKVFGNIGFSESNFILNGDPSYISFNEPLYKVAVFLEWLSDFSWSKFTKVHLIGIFKKEINKKLMEHYICTGGCRGVSEKPGVCQSETCPKVNHALETCDCADGKHYGRQDAVEHERQEGDASGT